MLGELDDVGAMDEVFDVRIAFGNGVGDALCLQRFHRFDARLLPGPGTRRTYRLGQDLIVRGEGGNGRVDGLIPCWIVEEPAGRRFDQPINSAALLGNPIFTN